MNNSSDYRDDIKLWRLFNQTAELTFKARENELFEYGLSRVQAGVLIRLKAADTPLSPTEISRKLCRQPNSTTNLLSRMEKGGLIKKTKDPEMKNIKRFSLTEKGKELYKQVIDMETPYKLLSCLSPEEKATFSTCLSKLRDVAINDLASKRASRHMFSID